MISGPSGSKAGRESRSRSYRRAAAIARDHLPGVTIELTKVAMRALVEEFALSGPSPGHEHQPVEDAGGPKSGL
jgi:hypothetical protein